jgi:nicotinamidase-related amidase
MLRGKSKNGFRHPYVLIDLNTQCDFFDPAGAFPVVNASDLHSPLRRVIAWVRRNHIPVISSMDSHRRQESVGPGASRYCIDGTSGHGKLPFTLLPNRVFIAGDNTLAVSIDLFRRHQQVIFPQRSQDLFANPKADRFMTQLQADEFIILGAAAENAVKAVALGLLARDCRVTVVAEACGSWSLSESDLALRQMEAKGARIVTIDELVTLKSHRLYRYTKTSLVSAQRPNGKVLSSIVPVNGNGNGHSPNGVGQRPA